MFEKRVLVAGGGPAALETLLALRELAGHRVAVTLLAPEREFLYRPVTVGEPFARSEARAFGLAEIVAERPADRFERGSVARVYPAEHVVVTSASATLPYDTLVLAPGAVALDPLPGALTFRGREDVHALRLLLDELAAGRSDSIAFAVPSQRVWPLPAYELALMTASFLREAGRTVPIAVVTPEQRPLELFGPAAWAAVEPLLSARGVAVHTGAAPAIVRPGALVLAGGVELDADIVVTLPSLAGPRIPGVPHDVQGFIPVDSHGRVRDCDDVYAAGDATNFVLKQGGLATQQADAVAESIAADGGAPVAPRPFRPVLRGLLMTGGAPLYLRAELRDGLGDVRENGWAARSGPARRELSAAAGQPLWWPPAKIAGRYLAPFLATARTHPVASSRFGDRPAAGGAAVATDEVGEALELALTLADCDARWGDLASALEALDAAEALAGSLPPEYEAKRRDWSAAERHS